MSLRRFAQRLTARFAVDAVGSAPDSELIARFITDRDEAAFAALVGRHGATVRGVCRRKLGNIEDAEDAAQAVFLVLARNAARVRKHTSLASWLHGVAVRVCRKALSRQARGSRAVAVRPKASVDPANEAAWRDLRRLIDDALAALPEHLRQPLILCYLEGLTRDEAAARLGWSDAVFRGRLERGRDQLRRRLTSRGFPLPAGLLAVALSTPEAVTAAWAASVTRLILDPTGLSPAVMSLTSGVCPTMRIKLAVWLSIPIVAAGALTATVAARLPGHISGPPGPAVAKAFAPDPSAKPAAAEYKGSWVSVELYPNGGGRRTIGLTFVDDKHAVWQIEVEGPGAKSITTLRMQYRVENGELRLTPLERWVGEEKLPLSDRDKADRVYAVAWAKPDGKPAFDLTRRGEPDAKPIRFAPAEPPPPSDVPEALRGPRKPPAKEPAYKATPLYVELAFGPKAALRVWVVADGDRVFVDRNGNGDLTDDERSPVQDLGLSRLAGAVVGQKPRGFNFSLEGIADQPRGVLYSDMAMMTLNLDTGGTVAAIKLRVNGRHDQKVGITDLFLSPDPAMARLVHFDADRFVVAPHSSPGALDAAKPSEFNARLGTPGLQPGSFASRSSIDFPADKNPVAEFEFPAADPTAPAVRLKVPLADRRFTEMGVWDLFTGTVAIPEGVGKGPAKVTLSFPDCPAGSVEPRTYEVWFQPKPPRDKNAVVPGNDPNLPKDGKR